MFRQEGKRQCSLLHSRYHHLDASKVIADHKSFNHGTSRQRYLQRGWRGWCESFIHEKLALCIATPNIQIAKTCHNAIMVITTLESDNSLSKGDKEVIGDFSLE
eukprot:TRINITY_DN29443_c0_g1_i1.p1 TRINITY_DN29443_c0_g1~~TRINITY_DN29443_c0_g1_i1.p1  ORF type:complete len:104 (+),score=1.79 TRINITY_DN29443_c0_g1_i1:169-480(+)